MSLRDFRVAGVELRRPGSGHKENEISRTSVADFKYPKSATNLSMKLLGRRYVQKRHKNDQYKGTKSS